ncbi:histone-like nucleoid-structuring protein Lsr2 [Nocardia carnea]|uniref:histone-like nucleoid-structuring protein Lsr2 n=1 Tax=Nocardia carnea TaxID=37328 RepID=UPI002456C524|nr:Lsr2 family protein [Nocardia carnea]
MARKVIVELVDDFDGKSVADETVNFSLDGVVYEIDLSMHNAEKFRSGLDGWIKSARKLGGRGRKAKREAGGAYTRDESRLIRDWARKNGLDVSNRGRIAANVADAYRNARG